MAEGLSKSYLVLYNCVMFCGWAYILLATSLHVITTGTHLGTYSVVKTALYVFQTGALLEVVHAAFGLVKSSAVITFLQVFSRLFLVWGVCWSVAAVQDELPVAAMLLAWSVTEVIRYSYYVAALCGYSPRVLSWLRYSLFIVLYPIGVSGELLTIFAALAHIKATDLYALKMPNRLNMAIDYSVLCVIIMCSYIPVFPQLYLHMFSQRRKVLGSHVKSE